ncbi:hypothetical protein KJ605_01600 [Patescibacteria group bacterium]|nr:hypothetical protein [Patescibacteria group bacterium]
MSIKSNQAAHGHILVEVIIASALFVIIASAVLGGFVSARDGTINQKQGLAAKGYLDQAIEAVRSVRERDWGLIAVNGEYHPSLAGTVWELLPGEGSSVDGFTTRVVISDVFRSSTDPFGDIAAEGDIVDPAIKKIMLTVSWGDLANQYVSSVQYLSRHENNDFVEQTLEADFTDGEFIGTAVQNEDGGEVILGAGGYGNWCEPLQVPLVEVSLESNGSAAAIWAREGRVYAGTGENSSGKSFVNVDIEDTRPPTATVQGTFDGYKTNAIYGEGDYAYLATDTNSKEVVIIDTSTSPNTEIGYFDAPGNADANGVFVQGDVGYVTAGSRLFSFDLSSRSGSRPALDSNGVYVSIFGTARKMYVVGNYAYVAIDGYALLEMVIVDISNPSNLVAVGGANVNAAGGKEIYVNPTGTRAYLATNRDGSKPEFFIINTSSKTGIRDSVGSYNSGDMDPRGVSVGTGNRAILVGSGGKEYQVIDISDEAHPESCGDLDLPYAVNGVFTVLEEDGDAYAYIVAKDAGKELKIIEGGPGGHYASDGTFESVPFDVGEGKTAMFNRVSADVSVPDETQLRYQVATYGDGSAACESITPTYYGENGSSDSFYETEGSVPFATLPAPGQQPARCFSYKVYLETDDKDKSPIFNGLKVNYSL